MQGSSDTLPKPRIPPDKFILRNKKNLPEKELTEVPRVQKHSDQLKDELTRAGKTLITSSPETDLAHTKIYCSNQKLLKTCTYVMKLT